jgi:hypothetical protein
MTNQAPRTPDGSPQREPWSRQISLNGGAVSVWYDTRKWGPPETGEDGIVSLDRLAGDGSVALIAERMGIPSEVAVNDILEDARKKHPELQILCRDTRIVNGRQVSCLKYSCMVNAIPMIVYTYCYGGIAGTVQARAAASAASFDECEPDFTQLFDSLEIRPPAFPRLARMGQTLGFAGHVAAGALPVLGFALIRFSTHTRWESALLWTALLSLGVFVAGWLYAVFKLRLK